jgi:hypothetical protein
MPAFSTCSAALRNPEPGAISNSSGDFATSSGVATYQAA